MIWNVFLTITIYIILLLFHAPKKIVNYLMRIKSHFCHLPQSQMFLMSWQHKLGNDVTLAFAKRLETNLHEQIFAFLCKMEDKSKWIENFQTFNFLDYKTLEIKWFVDQCFHYLNSLISTKSNFIVERKCQKILTPPPHPTSTEIEQKIKKTNENITLN